MGDSDRMKNYISDYLENSLDPSTHKEFEDALKRSPDLRSITDNMTTLSARLNNLKYHKCSDEFSVKLRERIHTTSESFISRQSMVRYSFAASFVIILIVAIFTITNLSSESPEIEPVLQGASESPANQINPDVGNNANTYATDGEVEVGTKPGQNTAGDTTRIQQEEKINNPTINQVDQKR